MFIICGLVMSIFIGSFISFILTSNMKKGLKKNIATIFIALAIGFGFSGLLTLEKKSDEMVWNNGHCECGTKWKLVNIEHLKNNSGELYYYNCDNCNIIIRLHSNFNK